MDIDVYLRFLLALVFVLALIGILAWAARRFGLGVRTLPNRNRTRRLAIVEVAAVDSKRRLVLVRRDDKEHLVLLGANSELLIEPGIAVPASATAESSEETDE